jgi:hypothetical protein
VLLLVGITLVVVGLAIVASRHHARRVGVARARLYDDLGGRDIRRISGARCIGYEGTGGGVAGIRGSGALGLTGTQLRFVAGRDLRTISIPLDRVVSTSLTRSFRGSSITPYHRHPVLVVRWVSDVGGNHEVGWSLPEAVVWTTTIDQLVGN